MIYYLVICIVASAIFKNNKTKYVKDVICYSKFVSHCSSFSPF